MAYRILVLCLLAAQWLGGQDYQRLYYGEGPVIEGVPFSMLTSPGSLDDFVGRYNGQHNAYGKELSPDLVLFQQIQGNPSWWSQYRSKVISTLLSPQLEVVDTARLEQFLERAGKGPQLDLQANNWWVRIPVQAQLKGQSIVLQLDLRLVFDQQQRSRWVLHDAQLSGAAAEGIPEAPLREKFDRSRYLPPSAHDNGFISLKKLLDQAQWDISYYIERPTQGLQQLQYILQHGKLDTQFTDFYTHFRPASTYSFILDKNWKIMDFSLF